jgi:phospholipase C
MERMKFFFAIVFAVGIAGCSNLQPAGSSGLPGASSASNGAVLPRARHTSSSSGYIQHVVIVIQENRSFDDFFATFPGAVGATQGLMKTTTGQDVYVPLKEAGLNSDSLSHDHYAFNKEFDKGMMDGFGLVKRAIKHGVQIPAGTYAYRYVNPKYIQPYWAIAQQWVLADNMFTTQGSSSFTAHQDFIAGGTPIGTQGDNVIDFPVPSSWGCNAAPGTKTNLITPKGEEKRGKGPFPCFEYETIRDLLDGAGLSWLYFTKPSNGSVWNAFDAIDAVRNGPEWNTNIITPETEFFTYIDYGELPAVSYVIPDTGTSDHPGLPNDRGPEWVASVVNAVGESQYWPSTVVIVVWDEWGGEYDNVPPPQLDGQGLGPRIPMLIISPYDKMTSAYQQNYISHTQYEDGSVLKFIEENWGLGSLGTSDVRANSISDVFDFTQSPRQFVQIPTRYGESYWKHYKPSSAPIDDY